MCGFYSLTLLIVQDGCRSSHHCILIPFWAENKRIKKCKPKFLKYTALRSKNNNLRLGWKDICNILQTGIWGLIFIVFPIFHIILINHEKTITPKKKCSPYFEDTWRKLNTSLPLVFLWPELRSMATLKCQGDWEIQSLFQAAKNSAKNPRFYYWG